MNASNEPSTSAVKQNEADLIVFRVLGPTGDERFTWIKSSLEQVKEAQKKFYEYIDKGFKAFYAKGKGKGELMLKFDPQAEEFIAADGQVVLVPPQRGG